MTSLRTTEPSPLERAGSRHHGRIAMCFAASLLAIATAATARAQCTTRDDASAVKRSITKAVKCNDKIFRSGPGTTCSTSAPPACAGTLVGDAVALAYGPNDPPAAAVDRGALHDQLACQKKIGQAVSSYVATKLKD